MGSMDAMTTRTVEDEVWSMAEAARRLAVPYKWLQLQVRAGRVPTQKTLVNGHWANVASAAAWREVARRYEVIGDGLGAGFPYHPLRSTLMTVVVYTGFVIAYGRSPRCVVCGKDLATGTWWRWFVPPSFQPGSGEKEDLPELALGCASGHEGARIFVASRWWIVGEDGGAPRWCEEVAAGAVQGP